MSRPVRRASDIHLAALDVRRAGEQLMTPCGCNDKEHTLAEHLWHSTKDMEPGLRSSNTDPKVTGTSSSGGTDPDADPTLAVSERYKQLVQTLHGAALDLTDFVAAHRPDRVLALPTALSDQTWCRSHLRLGVCEPRWRTSERCRWCADFEAIYQQDPPLVLLQMRRQGQRIMQADITEALRAERAATKLNRRKRKAG